MKKSEPREGPQRRQGYPAPAEFMPRPYRPGDSIQRQVPCSCGRSSATLRSVSSILSRPSNDCGGGQYGRLQ